MDFLQRLFSTQGFMPHGSCYMWKPGIIGLHVISDSLIALAYYSIPLTLVYFVRRRKDLAFDWMFLCFAVFIVACGTTHVMEIVDIWHPLYWLAGVIKAITAATSVVTAILLVRLVPKALSLPSPEQLRIANVALQREVQERSAAVSRVEELNRQLSAQTAEMEETNQELEAFSYSVSHDLRAPLRHIGGYVEILREEIPSLQDSQLGYMKVISDSAQKMSLLIDNLLAFSRRGRDAMHFEWIETAQVVEEARQELAPETEGRKIDWKIDPLPRVYADKLLFTQAWINLLSNAVKYTARRERAEIAIGVRETADRFEFSIRDNGAGFDMQYQNKLFGIFQRLHQAEDFQGTGIGLANVRRIVLRHGGKIRAEGKPDAGATFFFTLPKAQASSSPEKTGAAALSAT